MDIGNKIKSARIAKGMTQEELGKHLGVQKSAIAKYENGRVINIKRSILKKISDVLDIRPSDLIFEEQKQPVLGELSPKKREFIKRVEEMTDAQLERLEQILSLVEGKE